MYQSVDQTLEDQDAQSGRARKRLWVGFILLFCLGLLIAVAILSQGPPPEEHPNSISLQTERSAYQLAISDPNPAYRRARLMDFVKTYETSEHRISANALLDVLNQEDAQDWAVLSEIVFDPEASKDDKLSALKRYETEWDPNILGGREKDIAGLYESLDLIPEGPSPWAPDLAPENYPDGGSGDLMVGGIVLEPLPPDVLPPPRLPQGPENYDPVIIPAKIKRNSKPRFPRQAERDNVEGLVVLKLFISDRGRVEKTEVVYVFAEKHKKRFIKSAERSARKTRFYPRTIDGEPIPEVSEKRYRFTIAN